MYGIAHDITQVLPCAGCDLQQTFFSDTFQKRDEMGGFQFRHWQMTYHRENMVIHAGKQAVCGILRPSYIALMPLKCQILKDFFRRAGCFFGETLLGGVDVLREQLADTITLLPCTRQGYIGVST